LIRRIRLTLCLLLSISQGVACARVSSVALTDQQRTSAEAATSSTLNLTPASDKSSISLPFDLIDNRIVINVWLNGKGPFRFIFDSGGVAIVSPEVGREIGLKIEGTSTDGGVGEKTVERGATNIAEVKVGDIRLTNEEFGVISFADNKYVFGANRIDGVIGYPLFKRFVVKIDYEQGRLTFIEPSAFAYHGNGISVPLDFDAHLPLVNGSLDGVPGIFVIDTGARSALLLYGPFVEKNNLRAKYQATLEGVTGWGIGGPVRSGLARVRSLKLGAVEVRNLVARLSLQKNGALANSDRAALVGPDVLKQFTTIFDYPRKQLIFEKNSNYGKPDSYDRAGMWFGQEGDHFEVIDLIAGSPASEAGIKVGDQILAIDGQRVTTLDLPAVRLRFKNDPPQKRVRLTMRRDGAEREVVIILRDLV
jgi:membrane-associated protease RseP (regulator of RpoE activity)